MARPVPQGFRLVDNELSEAEKAYIDATQPTPPTLEEAYAASTPHGRDVWDSANSPPLDHEWLIAQMVQAGKPPLPPDEMEALLRDVAQIHERAPMPGTPAARAARDFAAQQPQRRRPGEYLRPEVPTEMPPQTVPPGYRLVQMPPPPEGFQQMPPGFVGPPTPTPPEPSLVQQLISAPAVTASSLGDLFEQFAGPSEGTPYPPGFVGPREPMMIGRETVDEWLARQRESDQMGVQIPAPMDPVAAQQWRDTFRTIPGRVQAGMAEQIAGMQAAEMYKMLEAVRESKQVPAGPEFRGKTWEEAAAILEGYLDEYKATAGAAEADIEHWSKVPQTFMQRNVAGVAQSLPQTALAIAVGYLTRNPTLAAASMYPPTTGQAFVENANYYDKVAAEREAAGGAVRTEAERMHDYARALDHGRNQGLIESGTELFPFTKLFAKGSPMRAKIIEYILADIPGETAATIGQTLDDVLAKSPEGATLDEVIEALELAAKQLPETWAQTVMQGGFVGATVTGAEVAGERTRKYIDDVRAARNAPPTQVPNAPPPGAPPPGAPPQTVAVPNAPPPGEPLAPGVQPAAPAATPAPTQPETPSTPYIQPETPAAEPGTMAPEQPAAPPPAAPAAPIAADQVTDGARIESPVRGDEVRGEGAQAPTPEPAVTERPPPPASAPTTSESQTVTPEATLATELRSTVKNVDQRIDGMRRDAAEFREKYRQNPNATRPPPKVWSIPIYRRKGKLTLDGPGTVSVGGRLVTESGYKLVGRLNEDGTVTVATPRKKTQAATPTPAAPTEAAPTTTPTQTVTPEPAAAAPAAAPTPTTPQSQTVTPEPAPKAAPKPKAPKAARPISQTDPGTMTAGEINRELDKLEKQDSQLGREMIDAGRGDEKFTDSQKLAKEGDAMAQRRVDLAGRMGQLRSEIEVRSGQKQSRMPKGKSYGPRREAETEPAEDEVEAMQTGEGETEIAAEPETETAPAQETAVEIDAALDDETVEEARGSKHQPMMQQPAQGLPPGQTAPTQPAKPTVTLGKGARQRTVETTPEKPIRREDVMALFQRLFNAKITAGKPFKFGKTVLGFFRPKNREVRIRKYNDMETAAHEMFHWLDRTFPTLRALYHEAKYKNQLTSISYDARKLHEGFAEFGRLFMTNEINAVQHAGEFYEAFIREAHKLGILELLERVQTPMHQWFNQGTLAQAESKINFQRRGFAGIVEKVRSLRRRYTLGELLRGVGFRGAGIRLAFEIFDDTHIAKVIERELSLDKDGNSLGIADDAANSTYKQYRLLAHVRQTVTAFIHRGTARWTADNDLDFNGEGLTAIFSEFDNDKDLEDLLAYMIGMHAKELVPLDKEHLLTDAEIQALIDRGLNSKKSAEIQDAHDRLVAYQNRVIDFGVQSQIFERDTVDFWKRLYQSYVPFFRVAEHFGTMDPMFVHGTGARSATGDVVKLLKGGTQNLQDILLNITLNTATIVEASMRNMAKIQLFDTITSSPLGQRWAVKIGPDTEARSVDMKMIQDKLKQLADEARTKAQNSPAQKANFLQIALLADQLAGENLSAVQDQATFFFGGQTPRLREKDSLMRNGKREWYQIQDKLLFRMLEAYNHHETFNALLYMLGRVRRTIQGTVTSFPDFVLVNWFRDMQQAYTLSNGQLPVIDAVKGIVDVAKQNETYWKFILNGGGFGTNNPDEAKAIRVETAKIFSSRGLNLVAILDTPARVHNFLRRYYSQTSEMATRLAEVKVTRDLDKSWREAAYQGNDIGTDWGMRGRSRALRTFLDLFPFGNASVQSLYRMYRELYERKGKLSSVAGIPTGDRVLRFALKAAGSISIPSLMIYLLLNRGDDDYEKLPEDVRSLNNVVPLGPKGDFILVPRAYETGILFGDIPVRIFRAIEKDNPKEVMDGVTLLLARTFGFQSFMGGGIFKGPLSVMGNTTWNGLPVVPRSLEGVEAAEQFGPETPEIYKYIGRKVGASPLKIQAVSDSYLNNLGFYIAFMTDEMLRDPSIGEMPDRTVSQTPILRRFIRERYGSRMAQEKQFYDFYQMTQEAQATLAKYKAEGQDLKVEAYMNDPAKEYLLGVAGEMRGRQAQVNEIRANMMRTYYDPVMSGEEKRKELDSYIEQRNEIIFDTVQEMNADEMKKAIEAAEAGTINVPNAPPPE